MNKSFFVKRQIIALIFLINVFVYGAVFSTVSAQGLDSSRQHFAKTQLMVGREKYPKWIAKQMEGILKEAGPAFAEVISMECLIEAVTEMLSKYKPEEVKENIKKWNNMIKEKNFDLVTFWDQVIHCEGFCSLAIAKLMTCYMNSVAKNYSCFVLFDYGESYFKNETQGGWWSNDEKFNNLMSIVKVTTYMKLNPSMKVYLHARASQFGNKAEERSRSIKRANSVKKELMMMKRGVSGDRIKIQAFGWEPPHIDEAIAKSHGIEEDFKKYSDVALNQSVLIYVYE